MRERTLTETIALGKFHVCYEISSMCLTRALVRSRMEKWDDALHDAETTTFMFSFFIQTS